MLPAISAAASAITPPGAPPITAILAVAAQATILADAVSVASDIPFESQQDARASQARISGGLAAAMAQAAAMARTNATTAGSLWRALRALDAAWAADMTATIGRLPVVATFTPPANVPLWIVAQYLAGDTPDRVIATHNDLRIRNRIANPAVPPSGPLEVLRA